MWFAPIPRSGANLLTDGLRDTRRAACLNNFFCRGKIRYAEELGTDPLLATRDVRAIVNAKVTRNEVFGFKLMSWYLDDSSRGCESTRVWKFYTKAIWSGCAALFPVFVFCASVRDVTNAPRHCPRLVHFRQDFGNAEGQKHSTKTGVRSGPNRASLHEAERQEKSVDIFFPTIGSIRSTLEYEKLAGIMKDEFAQC